MKKIKSILLVLIINLLMPNLVDADCGATTYENYNAKVKNSSGAITYDTEYNEKTYKDEYHKSDYVIPYGSVVEINHDEYKLEDDYLLQVSFEDNDYIVKASDLENIDSSYSKKESSLKQSDYYTVVDTELRSGPGVLYDVVGVIKADTNIMMSGEPAISGEGEGVEGGSWILISDGNISGYIFYDGCFASLPIYIGQKVNEGNYYFVGSNNNEYNLKYGDKINVKYSINYAHSEGYYIEVNGKRYELNASEVGVTSNKKIILFDLEKLELYDNNMVKIDNDDNLKTDILYNSKYSVATEHGTYYHFEVNDKIYIIDDSGYIENFEDSSYEYIYAIVDEQKKISFEEDMYYGFNIYQDYKIMEKGKSIDAYKLLNEAVYDDVYYNSSLGFFHKITDINDLDDSDEDFDEENINSVQDDVIVVEGLTAKDYVIRCLLVSIFVAVIVIILIIFINRNKNKTEKIIDKEDQEISKDDDDKELKSS